MHYDTQGYSLEALQGLDDSEQVLCLWVSCRAEHLHEEFLALAEFDAELREADGCVDVAPQRHFTGIDFAAEKNLDHGGQ